MAHKSGIVNIIGLPNAGKSTLVNSLTDENLAIVTHKAQTTRHRLKAILNHNDYQIIFCDTPGIIKPDYQLHKMMMKFVEEAMKDTDVILIVVDAKSKVEDHEIVKQYVTLSKKPLVLAINKSDIRKIEPGKVIEWKRFFSPNETVVISAKTKENVESLINTLLQYIPEHPAYYDKEELTDRPVRFFVQEIIRQQVLLKFHEEVPYAIDVYIDEYKDKENITYIRATLVTERESQKAIILGNKGEAIKNLGSKSRELIEKFIDRKVFLDLGVKVKKDWRNDLNLLQHFGYK